MQSYRISLIVDQLDQLFVRRHRSSVHRVHAIFDCDPEIADPFVVDIFVLNSEQKFAFLLILEYDIKVKDAAAHQPTALLNFFQAVNKAYFKLLLYFVAGIHDCNFVFKRIDDQMSLFESIRHRGYSIDVAFADVWLIHSPHF
jgi:hypothetical protein